MSVLASIWMASVYRHGDPATDVFVRVNDSAFRAKVEVSDLTLAMGGDLGGATGTLSLNHGQVSLVCGGRRWFRHAERRRQTCTPPISPISPLSWELTPHATLFLRLPITGTLTAPGLAIGGTFTLTMEPYDVFGGTDPLFDLSISGAVNFGNGTLVARGTFDVGQAPSPAPLPPLQMRRHSSFSGTNLGLFVGSGGSLDSADFTTANIVNGTVGFRATVGKLTVISIKDAATATSYLGVAIDDFSAQLIGVDDVMVFQALECLSCSRTKRPLLPEPPQPRLTGARSTTPDSI